MSEKPHPARYPIHDDPDKGQVYGGICNITRCDRPAARYWNMGTYGLYCSRCAEGINWRKDRPPLCVAVEAKPLLADMEQFKIDHNYAGTLS
jgi:hypothetical protein